MMRSGAHSILRLAGRTATSAPLRSATGRRLITTQPPHLRSRSWKSSALRWGIAIAGIYYYNTSPVFAESPEHNLLNPNVDAIDTDSPTLEALTASSRRSSEKKASILQSAVEKTSVDDASPDSVITSNTSIALESPAELEEEAAGEGAFNPETGEINWDCPCLGGMAHGPCGPQFREAFSCFVFSNEEHKGMDCIDKFQNMQNCFREHPEVYKGEIEDEEELDAELAQEREQLAKEIAERKKVADAKVEQQRLLEEPVKTEKPKKKKSKEKVTTNASHAAPPSEMKTASSSEPHPGMSADHEALKEGAEFAVNKAPTDMPLEVEALMENELIPRASYDATNTASTAR